MKSLPSKKSHMNIGHRSFKSRGHSRDYHPEYTGSEQKIRGNPAQILEKYMNLARDAMSSGDWIAAEGFYQHAEHYRRVLAPRQEEMKEECVASAPVELQVQIEEKSEKIARTRKTSLRQRRRPRVEKNEEIPPTINDSAAYTVEELPAFLLDKKSE